MTGSDTVRLDGAGERYFICGAPGHCAAGMKLQVRVISGGRRRVRQDVAAARRTTQPCCRCCFFERMLSLLLVVVGLVIVYLILLFHSCRNTQPRNSISWQYVQINNY